MRRMNQQYIGINEAMPPKTKSKMVRSSLLIELSVSVQGTRLRVATPQSGHGALHHLSLPGQYSL